MKAFDVVILLTPILETIKDTDHKLQVLVALENGTNDKEVFSAINELRWAIMHTEEMKNMKLGGVPVGVDQELCDALGTDMVIIREEAYAEIDADLIDKFVDEVEGRESPASVTSKYL